MRIPAKDARPFLKAMGAKLPAKRSKYGAVKTAVGGLKFASKREARRYGELVFEAATGRIHGLLTQTPFDLVVNGKKVCVYVADFTYTRDGVFVVEDCKGFRTRDYKLKKKLMLAVHGIAIVES